MSRSSLVTCKVIWCSLQLMRLSTEISCRLFSTLTSILTLFFFSSRFLFILCFDRRILVLKNCPLSWKQKPILFSNNFSNFLFAILKTEQIRECFTEDVKLSSFLFLECYHFLFFILFFLNFIIHFSSLLLNIPLPNSILCLKNFFELRQRLWVLWASEFNFYIFLRLLSKVQKKRWVYKTSSSWWKLIFRVL